MFASVHAGLTQDEETMTARLIKVLEHPKVTMLGHMSGRLLLKREPSRMNIQKIIDAAIANGKIIELNANPIPQLQEDGNLKVRLNLFENDANPQQSQQPMQQQPVQQPYQQPQSNGYPNR